MLSKFGSRKFLMALLSVITGILTLVGVADSSIEIVSSIGLILIPSIIYIITEGKIDAARLTRLLIDDATEIMDLLGESEVEEI